MSQRAGWGLGNSGFTYIGMVVMIMIIGITSSVVGQSWRLFSKTEKEKELLWRGHQFRLAIKRYYEGKSVPGHAGINLYPSSLDDLLKDPRNFGTVRYLRKKYTDPMTGKDDWVPIMDGNGRIKGVHSNSDAGTLKRDNFDLDDIKFRGKTRYSEWEFIYDPNAATGAATVITTGAANPPGGATAQGGSQSIGQQLDLTNGIGGK